jgi:hypothetical protein
VLPVHHFHLVFTLPAELRGLAYAHKRAVYDLLFAAASATLARMSADKLGGTPGVTLVLHTWTRTLGYHPHLHAIVTGGALSSDGARWKPARQAWLFPVAELAARFRGAFLSALRASPLATDAVLDLVRRLYRRRWVVYAKRAFGGAEAVYRYLGRYTHRVGLSNQRLVSLRGGAVVFRTRGDARMRLPGAEFAACFLHHVLPLGFRKVRHYGLLAPTNVRTRLARAGQLLHKAPVPPAAPLPDTTPAPARCPTCGATTLETLPLPRGPPDLQDPLDSYHCRARVQHAPDRRRERWRCGRGAKGWRLGALRLRSAKTGSRSSAVGADVSARLRPAHPVERLTRQGGQAQPQRSALRLEEREPATWRVL